MKKKIFSWTKLKPKHTFYIIDDNNFKCRIICIYGNITKEQSKKLSQLERKYFDFVNIYDYIFMSSKHPHFLDVKYSNIFERIFSVRNGRKKKKKEKIITVLGFKFSMEELKEKRGKKIKYHKVITLFGIKIKFKIKGDNNG